MKLETCSICPNEIPPGAHEICRACVIAHNWSLARFGYSPSGQGKHRAPSRTASKRGDRK